MKLPPFVEVWQLHDTVVTALITFGAVSTIYDRASLNFVEEEEKIPATAPFHQDFIFLRYPP